MKRVIMIGIAAMSWLFLSPCRMYSDTVTGNAGFQSWSSSNLDEDGQPYWDTPSLDGSFKSVGAQLVALSGTSLAGGPGAVPFWGNPYVTATDSGGSADTDFFFSRTSSATLAELKLEISAYASLNQFGWYDVANPSVLHSLFPGAVSTGAATTFTPTPQYGFYLYSGNGQTYFTQSSLNPAGETGHQHFSLFRQLATPGSEVYWVGLEDLSLSNLGSQEGGTGDYNDMIIRLEAVPEPSTLFLLGAGLAGIWAIRRQNERL